MESENEPRCRKCGETREESTLMRMDDRAMPTEKVYECVDECGNN